MTHSVYCLDNDIILKLVTYDLFNNTLQTFDININQVNILETFRYRLKQQQRRKRRNSNLQYDLEAAQKVSDSCGKISETQVINFSENNIFNQLQVTEGIDVGEAILISYVCYLNQRGDDNYLLTGDKRCLKALASLETNDFIQNLEGKVWCFEQLILKNIEQFGFNFIQSKIYPVKNCDTNIKLIFGYSEEASENAVTESLRSEIIALKQKTGNLLYPYPD